jgi:hypothetical protein
MSSALDKLSKAKKLQLKAIANRTQFKTGNCSKCFPKMNGKIGRSFFPLKITNI